VKRIISALLVLSILAAPACAWFQKHVDPALNDAISCVETEAVAAGSGVDVIAAADEIITVIGAAIAAIGTDNLSALWAALAPLVTKFGEPTVACVWKDLAGSDAGSGSALTAEDEPDPIQDLARHMITYRKWSFR
jgi:hypothetical protein